MALPSDWYFGGAPRLRDVYGGFNVGDIQPQQPQAPTTAATPSAPSARLALSPAGGFKNTFADGQVPDGNMPGGSFGGAPTGPAAPGGPGPISNTGEAFSAFPGMSPIGATQAAQAQNTADINATNSLALQGPIGTEISALTGSPAVGTVANTALGLTGSGLPSPAAGAFAVPAAVMQGLGLFGLGPIGGNRSLTSDQNDINAAFPTINPFAPQPETTEMSSANAFDAPTGIPGTSGVNSAGQSVGFGAPGTAGAGVAGGFSSAFGGSGAGGAVGGTNFGGVGNTTGPAATYSGTEGEAPGPGPTEGEAPGPGPSEGEGPGPGPGDAGTGPSGGEGDGGSGDGGGEKRGGLIGKRQPGQRPDPKMLAAKLKAGGGTVTKGSKKPGADDVPVRLSKNEFVEPVGAVEKFGPLLEQIRQEGLRSRSGGMAVGPARSRR